MAALVASLMREQRAAEDRAIFDAYQNGGKYKGKLVTDDVILKYIKGRRDGFATDDPLYDEWNNRLMQTEFSIGEQKVGLAFKEGKVGAGAVAAFYRRQLKKIPKDSAFYREVAGRATEWAKASVGAARGRARARASSGVRSRLNAEVQKGSQYLALERALTDYAIRTGVISPGDSLTDADATELQEMFNRGIFTDAARRDRITFSEFQSAAQGYYKNLDRQIALQVALGNQGVEARRRRDKHLYGTLLKLNAVDDRAGYELLRERWLSDIDAAAGDPYAIAEANKKYAAGLETIHKNATRATGKNENDPEFISGLVHEHNAVTTGKATGPSVAEQYGERGDAEATAESVTKLVDDMKLLDTNKAYYGQTEPGGAFGVVRWPEGLGGDPLGLDDSLQPSLQVVNGVRRLVYLKGKEINSTAIYDPETGETIQFDPGNMDAIREGLRSGKYELRQGRRVGYTFTNPKTGKKMYGVNDPVTGKMVFTDENPFASDIIGLGEDDVVFTDGVVSDGRDDVIPDPARVLKAPVSLTTGGSPLLSDDSVSAKDLLTLLGEGKLDVDENDIAIYRARLERDARMQSGEFARDQWYQPSGGTPKTPTYGTRGDSPSELARDRRDAGAFRLPDVQSLVPNLQNLFNRGGQGKDDLYIPPAPKPPTPPKPPAPKPPPRPPKPTYKPPPKPKPKPKPTVHPVTKTPVYGVDPDDWNAYGGGGPGGSGV